MVCVVGVVGEGGGSERVSSPTPAFSTHTHTHTHTLIARLLHVHVQKAFIAQEKEKRRRLKPGTLVMGISPFRGQEEGVSLPR